MDKKEYQLLYLLHTIETHSIDDVVWGYANFDELSEISKLIPEYFFESGIECYWKKGYICINVSQICDFFGFDENEFKS